MSQIISKEEFKKSVIYNLKVTYRKTIEDEPYNYKNTLTMRSEIE